MFVGQLKWDYIIQDVMLGVDRDRQDRFFGTKGADWKQKQQKSCNANNKVLYNMHYRFRKKKPTTNTLNIFVRQHFIDHMHKSFSFNLVCIETWMSNTKCVLHPHKVNGLLKANDRLPSNIIFIQQMIYENYL